MIERAFAWLGETGTIKFIANDDICIGAYASPCDGHHWRVVPIPNYAELAPNDFYFGNVAPQRGYFERCSGRYEWTPSNR